MHLHLINTFKIVKIIINQRSIIINLKYIE